MANIFKTIAKSIGAIAPTVANLVVPGSGPMLDSLMRAVTGDRDSDIELVAARIQQDPKLMLELERVSMEREVGLAQVEAAKLETVNATMRMESRSEHWPQYSWRPFNGFMFPLTMFAAIVVLPACGIEQPEMSMELVLGWLSILGVATVGRNRQKAAQNGDPAPGILAGVINAIKKN